jgi:dipeptidyl aminopeptidase/acylaminoacyl peptidase
MKSHLFSASALHWPVWPLAAITALPDAGSQDKKEDAKWDVSAPPGLTIREIPISVDEGTWMNVDVSPDGRLIAFDMLGDIYTMPIAGGAPTRIAEGLAYETQPRFSPDGKRISFTSDRGGGDNIWIMNADGSGQAPTDQGGFPPAQPGELEPRRPVHCREKAFHHAAFARARARSGCITSRAVPGCRWSRSPTKRTRRSWVSPSLRPTASISTITRNTTPGPIFEYAQDSNNQLFAIERYASKPAKPNSCRR